MTGIWGVALFYFYLFVYFILFYSIRKWQDYSKLFIYLFIIIILFYFILFLFLFIFFFLGGGSKLQISNSLPCTFQCYVPPHEGPILVQFIDV